MSTLFSKQRRNTVDYSQHCSAGITHTIRHIAVEAGVELQVVSYAPAQEHNRPYIIVVPGWISQIGGWTRILKSITQRYPVHYVETREKRSARVTGKRDYGVQRVGRDIAEIVTALGMKSEKYVLLGSSLGATAVLDIAPELPVNPLALVLIGANAEFRFPAWSLPIIRLFPPSLYLAARPVIKLYLRLVSLDVKSDPAQYAKYCRALDDAHPWRLKRGALALSQYEVWPRLESNHHPTLIIGAQKDIMHTPENLVRMASQLPRGQYIDLGTNHRTHGPEMVAAMEDFLARLQLPAG